jgi:hypothetical protein
VNNCISWNNGRGQAAILCPRTSPGIFHTAHSHVGSHVLAPTAQLDSRWPCLATAIKKTAGKAGAGSVVIVGERNLQHEGLSQGAEALVSVL